MNWGVSTEDKGSQESTPVTGVRNEVPFHFVRDGPQLQHALNWVLVLIIINQASAWPEENLADEQCGDWKALVWDILTSLQLLA